MKQDVHRRARQLAIQSRVEPLSNQDSEWLEAHVRECAACNEAILSVEAAVASVRAISVVVDPDLVRQTRLRVNARAREIESARGTGTVVSWVAAVLSLFWVVWITPYLWRGFAWIGHRAGCPDIVWQVGFGLWWLAPAMTLAAVLALQSLSNTAHQD